MTEQDMSGLGEFTPTDDKPKRGRRSQATASDDGLDYRGQWQARNDDGKYTVTTSKLAALEFACPPDRVKPFKHGDALDV